MSAAGRGSYTDRQLFTRILRLARPRWPALGALLLLDLAAAPLFLLTPVPLKIAIDSVIGDAPVPGFLDLVLPDVATASTTALLVTVAILQIAIVMLLQVQQLATLVLQKKTGESLTVSLRARLFRHVQRLSFSSIEGRGTADTVYRVQYDTPTIEYLTIHGMIPMAGAVVTLFSAVYVTARIEPVLAVAAVSVGPTVIWMQRRYKARMRGRYRRAKELESAALHVIHETLGAFRVVRAFGREDLHTRQFEDHSSLSVAAQVGIARAEGLYGMAVQLTTAAGTAVVLFIGTRAVLTGHLTLGELTLVLAYLARLFAPIQTLSGVAASLQGYLSSAQRVLEVIDEAPQVEDRPDAVSVGRATGQIETRDVQFGYGDDPPVLDAVDLTIPAGSRVGIFGPTGAGKTTLLSLLMRTYDPRSGAVLLDGRDIRDYRLAHLREQFSVVMQDSVLFSTTIAENIAYGRPGADWQDVVAAARLAGAHDFITGLPQGYRTTVGEKGMRLSGGERQRIALARAFLKDAPILVLDEPTSSVDTRTESVIMEAMVRLMAGRTTFMIAHRLSTLDVCDRFIHVDGGGAGLVDREEVSQLALGQPGATSAEDGARRSQTEKVEEVLRAVSADEGGDGGELTIRSRRDATAWTARPAELVTVQAGAAVRDLHLLRYGLDEVGRHDEPYAVHVQRRLLAGRDLAVLPLVGTYRLPGSDGLWVVTERPVDAWRLDEIATAEVMALATRWLADVHRMFTFTAVADMPDLRRIRWEEHLTAAAAIGRDPAAPHWLADAVAAVEAQAAELVRGGQTAILGFTYPENFLVADARVYPLALDAAAVGPGELDLAMLLEGWPQQIVADCTALYRRIRWVDGGDAGFERRLSLCRSLLHLRAISTHQAAGEESPTWRMAGLHDLHDRLRST